VLDVFIFGQQLLAFKSLHRLLIQGRSDKGNDSNFYSGADHPPSIRTTRCSKRGTTSRAKLWTLAYLVQVQERSLMKAHLACIVGNFLGENFYKHTPGFRHLTLHMIFGLMVAVRELNAKLHCQSPLSLRSIGPTTSINQVWRRNVKYMKTWECSLTLLPHLKLLAFRLSFLVTYLLSNVLFNCF